MADEAIITPDAEAKATDGAAEGSVEAQLAVDTPVEKKVETVPLAVYLELKEDLKSLKHEMKEAKGTSQTRIAIQGVSELAQKYPDVNEDFIKDMLSSATQEATKKIEEKYSPIIERQDMEKKKIAFDVAFDKLFDKTMTDNPELPKTIDKELIKELASTPKYRNTPLAEILTKMYGEKMGKSSSETETRSAPDRIDDTVDFQKVTVEQRKAIMSDPKAKAKYFAYLDTLG